MTSATLTAFDGRYAAQRSISVPAVCDPVASPSVIVIVIGRGTAPATAAGRLSASNATVNVSSSASSSSAVVIVPVALENPARIVMPASAPWSSASAVSSVSVSGIVTSLDSSEESAAVTITSEPSATVVGSAESDTVGAPLWPEVPPPLPHRRAGARDAEGDRVARRPAHVGVRRQLSDAKLESIPDKESVLPADAEVEEP